MSNMGTIARNTQKYGNAERMETGDGKGASPAGVGVRLSKSTKTVKIEPL